MGRISPEDIARVRDATDIVALIGERVVLRPKGRLFWGLCPFHGEKSPSFKVDPATQLWHCFGCGLGGGAFDFTMRVDNVDFPDAVRILADRARVEIHEGAGGVPRGRKERLFAAVEEAAAYYHRVLTGSRDKGPTDARAYLSGRGLGSDVAKRWSLGFAPGRGALVRHMTAQGYSADELVDANLALRSDSGQLKDRFYERIMFPIHDLQGRPIAFGGRVMGKGEPKYLNTNDTPVFQKSANLYAIDKAKGPITATGTALVVEGYTDVIALHEAGHGSAVATLGTALTKQHVKLLGRFAKRIVYLFDGDAAGMRAADRAVEFVDRTVTPEAGGSRVDLLVAVIPDGLDPADLVAQRGAEAMAQVVAGAVPLLRFAIDRRLSRWDLERPEERQRALKEAAEVLAPVKDSLLADDYANYIADRLMADFNTVRRAINEARPLHLHPDEPSQEGTSARAQAEPEHLTPELKAERELLGVLLSTPRVRVKARELLADALVSDPTHRAIAQVISEAADGDSVAAVASVIETAVPGASGVLAQAAMVDVEESRIDVVVDDLMRRVKEFSLERRISDGKARLKQPGALKDQAEYDEVFKEVSALQRELDALRRVQAQN